MKLELTKKQCEIIGKAWTKDGQARGAMFGQPRYDEGFIAFAIFTPAEARRISRVLNNIDKAREALK